MMNSGIPRMNKGPAHKAMPTTMSEKPRTIPVTRPRIVIMPIKIRNGSVMRYQTAATTPTIKRTAASA